MKRFLFIVALLFPVAVYAQAASQPVASSPTALQTLLALVGSAFTGGLGWLVVKASAFFHAHAKNTLGTYAAGVFDRLSSAAETCVAALVAKGQLDLASGLSKANFAQFDKDAVAYLKGYLGPQGLAELASVVGADQVAQVLSAHVAQAAATQVAPAKA
jgi:hypothetical protein